MVTGPLVTRVVVMLVVAAALVRWMPGEGRRDVLGRGDPLATLAFDRQLVAMGPDTLEARAHAKAIADNAPRPKPVRHLWTRMFEDVELVRDTADADTLIQIRTWPRNGVWRLKYWLYPVPVIGRPTELIAGGFEPLEPGATAMGRDGLSPSVRDTLKARRDRAVAEAGPEASTAAFTPRWDQTGGATSGLGALLSALLVCLVTGALVDRVLDRRGGLIERASRALMLGLGTVGTVSLLVDGLGFGVSLGSLGAGLACVALLCLALARRGPRLDDIGVAPRGVPASVGDPASDRTPMTPGLRFALIALGVLAVVGIALPVVSGWIRPTLQFDALVRWMFKTKVLATEGTLLGAVSHAEEFGMTHQRYPPLVSHVAHLTTLLGGRFDDRVASAIYPWFAVAMVGVCWGAVRRRAGALAGAVAAVWIAHLPLIAFTILPPPGAGAASAMADIPLALFVAGSLLALMDAVDGRPRAAWTAGLLLAFAALTKNEGLPLLAGAGLGLVVACGVRRGGRTALVAVGLPVVLFFVAWGRIAADLPAYDEDYAGQLGWQTALDGLARLPMIVERWGAELVLFRSWNLTWIALALLAVLGVRGGKRPALRAALVLIVIQGASYVFAYMITAWERPLVSGTVRGAEALPWLMELTLGRLLLQLAPAVIVLALIAAPWSAARRDA